VAGILAANSALHAKILEAISEERKIKDRKVGGPRTFLD
jgi:hypothetical protein